jgi:hypothetical protein
MYEYDGAGALDLTHLNAILNCCPQATLTVDMQADTIYIYEEDDGLCDCYCLFDLEYRILNLPPGTYRIVVSEAVFVGGEPIDFWVDLVANPTGMECVPRVNYPWTNDVSGIVIDHTGCLNIPGAAASVETMTVPPTQSCISYEYDGEGILSVYRANAGFNCCPERLYVNVSQDGNTITVTEQEILEFGYGCACLCLFDLEFLIANLPPGQYDLVIEELYAEGITIPLDLTSATSGEHCVERTDYPWGDYGY